jgi:streptogramin lyase
MLIKAAGGRVHGDASGGVEIPDDAVQRSRSTMEGSLFIFPEKKPVRSEIVIAGKCRVWRLVRTTIFFTLRNYAPRLILLGLIFATSAQAQTAQFSVSQTMIPSSKLYSPYRVAVDSTGNVYISDTQSNRVLKETWSSDGSYAESLVASTGLNLPCGIAVDSSGIIYFADELNARILRETPSGSGYVETQVSTSNLYLPTGVAVDHLGNIYIADTGNRRVLKETPFSGGYVETVVSSSGLPQVVGIAVDSGGNIFLSDVNTMQIYKEAPSGGAYLQTTIATTGLSHPYDIAVDAADNLYISDFDNARVIKETLSVGSYVQSVYPTYALRGGLGLALDISGNLYLADTLGQVVWKLSAAGGNLGPVRVGDQSRVGYLIFSFSGGSGGALTLGGARVVTQGFGGLDYADSGSGDCSTSVPYTAGDTCTIGVFFTPQYPGQRLGSAEVTDSTNHILAAGYISGSGIAPQINFVSGLESVVLSSASLHPQGLALDASGNIYIADCLNDVVLKITPLGIQSTVADSSGGMAVTRERGRGWKRRGLYC